MANNVTKRDQIWAAVIKTGAFSTSDLEHELPDDSGDRPSRETIQQALRAGAELGVINHRHNSSRYRLKDEYNPDRAQEYHQYNLTERFRGLKFEMSNEIGPDSGHMIFSPESARELGEKLIEFADEAE